MLATLFSFVSLFAEDPPAQPQGGPPTWYTYLPFVGIIVVFFFLMTRSMRKQEQQRQAMAATLEKGDKVLTLGEIYGTVISVDGAKNEVVVKIDDNTRVKMTLQGIKVNITKQEAAAAPKAPDASAQSTAVTTKPNT
jgi:preprotein translocase subunit YajC